jgi:hypothetical protein
VVAMLRHRRHQRESVDVSGLSQGELKAPGEVKRAEATIEETRGGCDRWVETGRASMTETMPRSGERQTFGKPPYAALWKSSIWRIQLVSGFYLGKSGATNLNITISR